MFFSRNLQTEADLWGKSRTGSSSQGGCFPTEPSGWSRYWARLARFWTAAPSFSHPQGLAELCRTPPWSPEREGGRPLCLFCLSQPRRWAPAGGRWSAAAKHAGCRRRSAGGGPAGGTGSGASPLWEPPGGARGPRLLRSLPARC